MPPKDQLWNKIYAQFTILFIPKLKVLSKQKLIENKDANLKYLDVNQPSTEPLLPQETAVITSLPSSEQLGII